MTPDEVIALIAPALRSMEPDDLVALVQSQHEEVVRQYRAGEPNMLDAMAVVIATQAIYRQENPPKPLPPRFAPDEVVYINEKLVATLNPDEDE